MAKSIISNIRYFKVIGKCFCYFTLLVINVMFMLNVHASPVETFTFDDELTKQRFSLLSKELRCPKCQNQNLADSNSKIAVDLRKNLYNLLQEGKTDQEIIDFMVYRYGDFVLYRPQLKEQTYVLWFGPIVILLAFAIGVVFVLKQRGKQNLENEQLSVDESRNLQDILNNKNEL